MAAPIPFGPEFLVNTTTSGDQDSSSVAALANGKFVVVWEDDSSGPTTYAIKEQIYNADGSRFGGEETVAGGALMDDLAPVVTGTADGRFVVAWQENDLGGPWVTFARVFNADGSFAGSPAFPDYANALVVSTTNTKDQTEPAIAAAGGGRFMVTWTNQFSLGDRDIEARSYNAVSAFSADSILVAASKYDEHESAIAGLANGNYVVVWKGQEQPDSTLYGHIFDGTGAAAAGGDFQLDPMVSGEDFQPTVAGLSNGRFVAVWSRHETTPGHADLFSGSSKLTARGFPRTRSPLPRISSRPSSSRR